MNFDELVQELESKNSDSCSMTHSNTMTHDESLRTESVFIAESIFTDITKLDTELEIKSVSIISDGENSSNGESVLSDECSIGTEELDNKIQNLIDFAFASSAGYFCLLV